MKRVLLGLALVATVAAAYFAPRTDETGVVVPVKKSAAAPREAVAAAKTEKRSAVELLDLQIRPRTSDEDVGNVFVSQTWTPPPPPPPPPVKTVAAVEVAQAPPLPFRFLGRLVDNGKTAYFLQFNDRNLVLRPGDTVDQTYVLDGGSDGTLTFTYLPLNQKQTLVVGEVN